MPLKERAQRVADRAKPLTDEVLERSKPLERRARRVARNAMPPPKLRPAALPVAAAVHEARWRLRLARAPTMTGAEHAARVGLRDIEEVIGCSLCGEERMQPLFTPEG